MEDLVHHTNEDNDDSNNFEDDIAASMSKVPKKEKK